MNILEKLLNYKDETVTTYNFHTLMDNPGATVFNKRLTLLIVTLFLIITGGYEIYLYNEYYPVDSNYVKTEGIHTEYVVIPGTEILQSVKVGNAIYGYVNKSTKKFVSKTEFWMYVVSLPVILAIILIVVYLCSHKIDHSFESGYPDF